MTKPQVAITQLPQLSAQGRSCSSLSSPIFFPPRATLKQILHDGSTLHHLGGSLGKRKKVVMQSTLDNLISFGQIVS